MNTTVLLAHAYGQSNVLELENHTLPPLASGMARIHVKASGINPIDARRITGELKHAQLPQTFGTEFAGVTENSAWKIGDEVLGSGGAFIHATVIDVPLANLVAKPKNLEWSIAGSIAGAAQTAMTILDEIGPMQSLLVHDGSGGVGSITIQLAVSRGITVIATASAKNQDYIRSLGAIPVVYGEGLIERLKKVHPHQFDASIDMVGNEDATQASLATVKNGGFMGTIAGRKLSSAEIQAVWVKRNVSNLKHVVEGVANNTFNWTVSREYPFRDSQQAYRDILEGHTQGKSVLLFK